MENVKFIGYFDNGNDYKTVFQDKKTKKYFYGCATNTTIFQDSDEVDTLDELYSKFIESRGFENV